MKHFCSWSMNFVGYFCYLITDIHVLTMSHSLLLRQQQKRKKKRFFNLRRNFLLYRRLYFFLQCTCLACVFHNFNIKKNPTIHRFSEFYQGIHNSLKIWFKIIHLKKKLNICNGHHLHSLMDREGVETSYIN